MNFDTAPAVGLALWIDGRPYELIATAPHVRRDGANTRLLTWQGACATCGGPFIVTTGLRTKAMNRRCPEHHRALKPATYAAARRKRARHAQP